MASTPTSSAPAAEIAAAQERTRVLSISFINFAHAIDHYVMLILATVVIELTTVYGWSYAELIALGTPSFLAFGVFSLPAGWLGDRWSRRNMMALFYFGCGASLAGAALAPSPVVLGVALAALGAFAAIYHPVGTAMLIEQATSRGRSLAFNGVCGNLGVALAAGTTALLVYGLGWRSAFLVPALIWVAATIVALFILIAISAGLVFHVTTVALPKIVDERLGLSISLMQVGGIATLILMCGALAQLTIGRLVDRFQLHLLFAAVALLQFVGVVWSAYASGPMLVVALAVAVAAIYAQVTVNDLVIARYTADAWRSRVFAVRYFLTFVVSAAAVSLIALLHGRGGFDLVLGAAAFIALGFVVGTAAIAVLVHGVEKERAQVAAPAE